MESPGPSRRALFRGQLLSKPVAIINDDCLAKAVRPRFGLPPEAIVIDDACTGCGDCVRVCPGDAITLGAARHGGAS
jgi:ferredoxin-type protein NapF